MPDISCRDWLRYEYRTISESGAYSAEVYRNAVERVQRSEAFRSNVVCESSPCLDATIPQEEVVCNSNTNPRNEVEELMVELGLEEPSPQRIRTTSEPLRGWAGTAATLPRRKSNEVCHPKGVHPFKLLAIKESEINGG